MQSKYPAAPTHWVRILNWDLASVKSILDDIDMYIYIYIYIYILPMKQFSQIILIQTIQFSINIDILPTQLNVKTFLFQTIQFSVNMQFTCQNSSISSISVWHKYAV